MKCISRFTLIPAQEKWDKRVDDKEVERNDKFNQMKRLLSLFEAILLPLVEQVSLCTTQVDDLGAAVSL